MQVWLFCSDISKHLLCVGQSLLLCKPEAQARDLLWSDGTNATGVRVSG